MQTICYMLIFCYQVTMSPTPTPVATMTPRPQPTVMLINFAGTIAANELAAVMTKQANEQQVEYMKATQAAAVINAENVKVKATQAANYLNATMAADKITAQANNAMMTAQRDNELMAQANETHAMQTAIAGNATAAMLPTSQIWTQQAMMVRQTVQSGEGEQAALAVKRQQAKNMFDALLPWTLVVGAVIVLGRGFATYVKTRTIGRDEHGRQQTIQRETPDGGIITMNLDQIESAILKITGAGEVIRYEPMDKQEQSDINRRKQIVDAIAALPMPYARNAQGMMKTEFSNQGALPSVQILDEARSLSPVLEEAESKLVEE